MIAAQDEEESGFLKDGEQRVEKRKERRSLQFSIFSCACFGFLIVFLFGSSSPPSNNQIKDENDDTNHQITTTTSPSLKMTNIPTISTLKPSSASTNTPTTLPTYHPTLLPTIQHTTPPSTSNPLSTVPLTNYDIPQETKELWREFVQARKSSSVIVDPWDATRNPKYEQFCSEYLEKHPKLNDPPKYPFPSTFDAYKLAADGDKKNNWNPKEVLNHLKAFRFAIYEHYRYENEATDAFEPAIGTPSGEASLNRIAIG
jgi:hypothetical protein